MKFSDNALFKLREQLHILLVFLLKDEFLLCAGYKTHLRTCPYSNK